MHFCLALELEALAGEVLGSSEPVHGSYLSILKIPKGLYILNFGNPTTGNCVVTFSEKKLFPTVNFG